MHGAALEGGAVGVIEGASRSMTAADGTVEEARTIAPDFLMGGVPVPARLGGGFLFWSMNVMYRARSFVGPLEPVAPLPTNAIDVALGPASLLIVDPGGSRKAYDMENAQRVPLSPHGVLDIATGDDERAIAVDASGRALASLDGGKTWNDVSVQLGGRPGRPYAASSQVGFEFSNKEGVWLQPDGTMVPGPLPDAHPAGATDSHLQEVLSALEAGIPLAGGQALVARGPEVKTVDVQTGAVLSTRTVAPGQSCLVLSTEDEGLAACYQYSVKKPSMTVVSHVLGATPLLEKTFEGTLRVVHGAGMLVVSATCDGAPSSSLACARRPGGSWTQYDAQRAVDATANPPPPGPVAAFLTPMPVVWVPREDGGVTALATKRAVKSGEQFHVARFDPPGGSPVFFDKVIAALENYRCVVGLDGTLRGFGPTSSIAVDAHGHVDTGAREFKSLAAADPSHALARDDAHRLWQTVDGGAHWIEVAPPPGGSEASATREGIRGDAVLARGVRLACHGGKVASSGLARGPAAQGRRGGRCARRFAGRERCRRESRHAPGRGRDGCTGHPSSSRSLALAVHAVRRTSRDRASCGGPLPRRRGVQGRLRRSALARAAGRSGLRDSRLPGSVHGGRRQDWPAVHRNGPSSRGALSEHESLGPTPPSSSTDKAVVDALYVEPFDPTGAILHATSSFASWAQAAGRTWPARRRSAIDPPGPGEDLGARPVLSSRPGHADGVLLGKDALVIWVDHTGTVRPVPSLQGGARSTAGTWTHTASCWWRARARQAAPS